MRVLSRSCACTLTVLFVVLSVTFCFGSSASAASSFCVTRDGFSISNEPGYCFAMAVFSRWYYLSNQGNPPLRKALNRKAQLRIARELQSYYSRNLIEVQADYCNRYSGNRTESFRRFVMSLMMGEPRLVLLMNKSNKGAILHAVLAFDWIPQRNLLRIYDPNYTNKERFIDLTRREYTSLDITYNQICFPEVLDDHAALVRKMRHLYATCITPRPKYGTAQMMRVRSR